MQSPQRLKLLQNVVVRLNGSSLQLLVFKFNQQQQFITYELKQRQKSKKYTTNLKSILV